MSMTDAPDHAGLVSWRRARSTGTQVGVYNGEVADLDTDGGENPWSTVCEPHGGVASHPTSVGCQMTRGTANGSEASDSAARVQASDQRQPDTEHGGLPQLEWQSVNPASAGRTEAPQASAHAVPQNNWQTTTRKLAMLHAAHPEDWCPTCQQKTNR